MLDMAMKDILPAVSEYSQTLCRTAIAKKQVRATYDCTYEQEMLERISTLQATAYSAVKNLETQVKSALTVKDVEPRANRYKNDVLPVMESLRAAADELETLVPSKCWCFPTYGELLFGVSE